MAASFTPNHSWPHSQPLGLGKASTLRRPADVATQRITTTHIHAHTRRTKALRHAVTHSLTHPLTHSLTCTITRTPCLLAGRCTRTQHAWSLGCRGTDATQACLRRTCSTVSSTVAPACGWPGVLADAAHQQQERKRHMMLPAGLHGTHWQGHSRRRRKCESMWTARQAMLAQHPRPRRSCA